MKIVRNWVKGETSGRRNGILILLAGGHIPHLQISEFQFFAISGRAHQLSFLRILPGHCSAMGGIAGIHLLLESWIINVQFVELLKVLTTNWGPMFNFFTEQEFLFIVALLALVIN